MKIASFYHIWVDGDWTAPAQDYFQAVSDSGIPGSLTVGVVGRHDQFGYLKNLIESYGVEPDSYLRTRADYEQFTLRALRKYAMANRDALICYAHSKGALKGEHPLEVAIRQSAANLLIRGWRECAELLLTHDAVGQHWLSPTEYPEIDRPIFGGNFWWARADYIAILPPPSDADRWEAEKWVGQKLDPARVKDLRPGWPTFGAYGQEITRILNPSAFS